MKEKLIKAEEKLNFCRRSINKGRSTTLRSITKLSIFFRFFKFCFRSTILIFKLKLYDRSSVGSSSFSQMHFFPICLLQFLFYFPIHHNALSITTLDNIVTLNITFLLFFPASFCRMLCSVALY